ncbi:hypothetical protein MNBD_GAMMA09-887 [hydrothermal vent metagenome]|uniref:Uncharacterized protein n=1 Tax=hydrothermal vent metagenome TaxID=652676 RepID=A0A3B0XEV1_9ZZZZ
MNKTTLIRPILATALFSLSYSTFAGSWSCRHDNNVREIQVQESTSEPVPCSVLYRKLTEGVEDQILWTAENDAGFCAEKAQMLVDKQISWGWTCVETLSESNSDDSTTPDTDNTESAETQEADAAIEESGTTAATEETGTTAADTMDAGTSSDAGMETN